MIFLGVYLDFNCQTQYVGRWAREWQNMFLCVHKYILSCRAELGKMFSVSVHM